LLATNSNVLEKTNIAAVFLLGPLKSQDFFRFATTCLESTNLRAGWHTNPLPTPVLCTQ
jgi:hypothetical protein